MDDLQFYPTPYSLAARAWRKFKNTNFVRILEPSAGLGDLAAAGKTIFGFNRHVEIDCCEIDVSKHAVLREKDFKVVALDFLQFGDGAVYSHICMNPPFAEGVKHVLKAWNMLWEGEIVAILNAESVRNPSTAERGLLASLIAQHGEVEFLQETFAGADAERKTNVEIALIHLVKKANIETDIIGNLFEQLRKDTTTGESLAGSYQDTQALAVPNSVIENAVLTFDAAVIAARDAAFNNGRAAYYSRLLGQTMAQRNSGESNDVAVLASGVQTEFGKTYRELKDRAWATILRSSNVTTHLSSAAQKRLESEFQQIKQFEFTVTNIYGFLCGLLDKQGEIQIAMACDVFDLFTKYHSDNTTFYRGWKSNNKHRTCGMRLRTTRFILPHHKSDSWRSSMAWESQQLLGDIDKVFAMLDGKRLPEVGLRDIFDKHFNDLRSGERVSSSYFDARYYPGIGTIHFFPRDKKLVDRLNRLVGRRREWLPPEGERVSEAFWLQYDGAEKFDKELRTEVAKRAKANGRTYGWRGPLDYVSSGSGMDGENEMANDLVDSAASAVLERHGICVDFQVETNTSLLLELA